jgi:SNF2 family DNA or RNA helicase
VRVSVYHGSNQQRKSKELDDVDIVLTTYETLRSEWTTNGALFSEKWLRLVLDEGQCRKGEISVEKY